MSASEVLTEESRHKIQRAWNCQPFNVYAATETAGIASECSRHRLHLFQDLVITEVVDEKNRRVPSGEFGAKLLVTVLFSRTQPLIRYEISDRVMKSDDRCDCGIEFALLGGIEGRAEDILDLPARSGGSVRIHPNLFHDILERVPVQAWQVLDGANAIRVLLVRPENSIDTLRLSSRNCASTGGARGHCATDTYRKRRRSYKNRSWQSSARQSAMDFHITARAR